MPATSMNMGRSGSTSLLSRPVRAPYGPSCPSRQGEGEGTLGVSTELALFDSFPDSGPRKVPTLIAYHREKPDSPEPADLRTPQHQEAPSLTAGPPGAKGRGEKHILETRCCPGNGRIAPEQKARHCPGGKTGRPSTLSLMLTHRPRAAFTPPCPHLLQREILIRRQNLTWSQHVLPLP